MVWYLHLIVVVDIINTAATVVDVCVDNVYAVLLLLMSLPSFSVDSSGSGR
jgi:hypothetical protein